MRFVRRLTASCVMLMVCPRAAVTQKNTQIPALEGVGASLPPSGPILTAGATMAKLRRERVMIARE